MSVAEELDRLGVALGSLHWVQGAGGNVSIKEGDTLYVKASGVRLQSVGTHFAGVPLAFAEPALLGEPGADEPIFARTPRPSLETYFHFLGGRVVAHTHALGVLLVACSSARFVELDVRTIPYERPGRGVALAIQRAFQGTVIRGAVLLERHGLIVYADTVDEAISMTRAVDARALAAFGPHSEVAATFDAYVRFDRETSVEGGTFRRLPPRRQHGGFLFPDAVVYGTRVQTEHLDAEAAVRALREIGRPCILVDEEGNRMAVAKNHEQLAFSLEVTCAHDWLEDALRSKNLAHYLPPEEPARILDLPAEKYRLSL